MTSPRRDIKSLLYLLVDVVIQCGVERHERFIKEIWFQPERKRRDRAGHWNSESAMFAALSALD